MTALALLLGIVAFIMAFSSRVEQARQRKQIERLRQVVFKLQAQPPVSNAADARTVMKAAMSSETVVAPQPPMPKQPQKVVEESDRVFAEALDEVLPPDVQAPPPVVPEPKPMQEESPVQAESSHKKDALHRLASPGQAGPKQPAFTRPATPAGASKPEQKPKPKPMRVSLEERLGAGVYIWAGGIALMLAGAFLVKYSFDNNLLSVQARLSIAGAFGAVLMLASLWVRKRADKVAAALCGAGVADMFTTLLAATAIYKVMDPWWGFALMVVVTAIAVGMSLMHGPFVALLGLVGGFATPTLISGDEAAWGPTFTYLLLLEIGLAVITRKKQWFGLSALTLAASIITTLAYTLFAWDPDHSYWLVMFAMGTAVVFVVNAARATDMEDGSPTWKSRIWLGLGAVGTSALLMTMFVGYSRFSMMELSALGLLGAGALLLARLDRRYITLAYLGAGLCGMMLLAWPIAYQMGYVDLATSDYYLLAIGYGLVFVIGGLLCVWRNARPGMFAWLSAGSALGFVILTHIGRIDHPPGSLSGWMVYAGVSALVTIGAALVWRTRKEHGTLVIDAYALMAAALATLAAWFGLDHPWVAPAWCGLAVVVAALGAQLRLRWLVIPVGWLFAGCVLQLLVPGPTGYDLPMQPIANTMLAHYGLPALGFAAIAWIYHRNPLQLLRTVSQALALVTATVAISLQVRLGFHTEHLWQGSAQLVEWSTYAVLWMGIGAGVLWRFKAESLNGLRKAAVGIGVVGLIAAVLHPMLISNPLLISAEVGQTRVLNWLLYIYGLPCVVAFLLARVMPKEAGPFKKAAGVVSFMLFFALVTLQVRHGFTGSSTQWRMSAGVGLREWATYSVVWMVISLAMLWIGRLMKTGALKKAALVMGMAGLGAAVLGTLVFDNPLIWTVKVGELCLLNWLLYIYGLPCVLAFVLARVLPKETGVVKLIASGVSFVLLFALVSMQVRQGFTGSDMAWQIGKDVQLHEWATYSVVWLLVSLVVSRIGARWRAQTFEWAGIAMGMAGMLAAVVGAVGVDNPLFTLAHVGDLRGFNWLLYIYGVPCLLTAAVALTSRTQEVPMKMIAVAVSLLLLFVLVSFEVRQGFVGGDLLLKTHPISSVENYSYSLAWVLLALGLLAGGLMTGNAALRYGSLAVMLVAVGKVALDTAQLRDLWRVLSLLGLGLSLIVLGYVYQRYVFRRPKRSEAGPEALESE